jgi:hypothetical protein
MSLRPRLKKNPSRTPATTAEAYRLRPVKKPNDRRQPKDYDNGLVILPNGRKLTQNPALPRLPGQVGLRGERPVDFDDIARAGEDLAVPLPPLGEQVFFNGIDGGSPSKHRAKRLRQWERWTNEILPLIIPTYIELQRKSHSLRDEIVLDIEAGRCQCCQTARKLLIWVIRSNSTFSCCILIIQ